MSQVFMKIIGRNRSLLPKGHINQTDVVGTPRALNILQFFIKDYRKQSSNKSENLR
jgi:hypothetical protein